MTEAAHGSFEELEMEFIAEEEGYVMAYTSNQTNENLNVFMDDMLLTHTTGPIVRVDDYYPFGLTFNSSALDNKLTNKFTFQGQEKQEGTGWYSFELRMYDSKIGRWMAPDPAEQFYSPYLAMGNNPVNRIDPTGGYSPPTTYIDENNRVLHVENDGETDILKFDDLNVDTWDKDVTSLIERNDGEYVGNTIFWFDFMIPDNQHGGWNGPAIGSSVINDFPSEGVPTGLEAISLLSSWFKNHVDGMDAVQSLGVLAMMSANEKLFDIKASLGLPQFNGVRYSDNTYTSYRVLGNILFGMNMNVANKNWLSKEKFWNFAMPVVGGFNGMRNADEKYFNAGFPFYGEHTLSGSAIWYGYYGEKP